MLAVMARVVCYLVAERLNELSQRYRDRKQRWLVKGHCWHVHWGSLLPVTWWSDYRAWVDNYIRAKEWDVIIYPCLNLNGIDVMAWRSNYIPTENTRCDYLSMPQYGHMSVSEMRPVCLNSTAMNKGGNTCSDRINESRLIELILLNA